MPTDAETVRRNKDIYAQAASAHGRASTVDYREANRQFDRILEAYLALSESEEGRAALLELSVDDDESVSLWAASHCLWFEPELARARLKELSESGSTGLVRLGARATLQEFDAGSLREPREWYRSR